jgi:rubrerythrin
MTETLDQAIQDVIRMAITAEVEANQMYINASGQVKTRLAKTMLDELATEELGHKAKLESLLRGGVPWHIAAGEFKRVTDLKLGDHLVEEPLSDSADIQNVLIVAIKREKEANELYTTMAGVASDSTVRNMFDFLANEEMGHKRKIESLYEDIVYKEF